MIQMVTNLTGEGKTQDDVLLNECTSIEWEVKRKVESLYGLSGKPRGRGFGNVEYTASIELPVSTQIKLRSMSDDKTLMGLGEFNIIVSWVNDLAQNVSQETTSIQGAFFNQEGMSAKQDDATITKTFDLNPYRIVNSSTTNTTNTGTNNTK